MKKTLKFFIVILIIVSMLSCGVSISNRTLSKQFKDENFDIFIPFPASVAIKPRFNFAFCG